MTFVWIIVAIIFLLLTFFIGYLISRSVVEKEYKNTYGELNNLKGEIFNAKRENPASAAAGGMLCVPMRGRLRHFRHFSSWQPDEAVLW